jgi:ribosome-associated protein
MLRVSDKIVIPDQEIGISAVRAQGAGGQNVNKVASAAHLRFDICASSLPEACKARLLALRDRRISADGVVIIKAQRHRTLEQNRDDALRRLQTLIAGVLTPRRKRIPTRPGRGAHEKRLERKSRRGEVKTLRRKVEE